MAATSQDIKAICITQCDSNQKYVREMSIGWCTPVETAFSEKYCEIVQLYTILSQKYEIYSQRHQKKPGLGNFRVTRGSMPGNGRLSDI
jgi:hypothetical protein